MIDEQTLLFYFYNDGLTDKERRDVDIALRSDPLLAARYAKLQRQFDDMRNDATPAAPTHMVQRWHDSIDVAARREASFSSPPQRPVHFWSFFWGAAITATLALGIGIGAFFSGNGHDGMSDQQLYATLPPTTATATPVAFTRGLEAHLQRSQSDISLLSVDSTSDRTVLVRQLIEQNRMFEYVADRSSAPELARVLRAFEPILLRLASEDIAPEDAEALRAQLSFELNVMLTKLARDTSKETHTT